MISSILLPLIVVVVGMVAVPSTMAWAPVSVVPITHHQHYTSPRRTVASFAKKSSYQPVVLFSSNTDDKEDVVAEQQQEVSQQEQQRTTFDQAGASLIEEEDKKRMDQMGDFDTNDAVSAIYKLTTFAVHFVAFDASTFSSRCIVFRGTMKHG
jgi:hypothetical protein